MSNLKNKNQFKLYYTDTDSFVVSGTLPPEIVGDKLGQFKLEHVVKQTVFVAPKVYAIRTSNDTDIIKI